MTVVVISHSVIFGEDKTIAGESCCPLDQDKTADTMLLIVSFLGNNRRVIQTRIYIFESGYKYKLC